MNKQQVSKGGWEESSTRQSEGTWAVIGVRGQGVTRLGVLGADDKIEGRAIKAGERSWKATRAVVVVVAWLVTICEEPGLERRGMCSM